MNFTPEQIDIHSMFGRRNVSLIVEAGAGTGKTSTLEAGNHLLPHSTLFLAFNKAIAEELARRMPGRTCKTFHAIALQNLQSRIGRLPVDSYKYINLAQKEGLSRPDAQYVDEIISLFQLKAEGALVDCAHWEDTWFMDLADHDSISLIDIEKATLSIGDAVKWAKYLLAKEAIKPTGWTFNDMLWMLVYFASQRKWHLRDYDCVVIDEAQDVSSIRLEILKRLTNRVIAVGDRRQSIYAFAGAMVNSMDLIQEQFKCEVLPLSITWRCDQAIIEEAEKIVGPFLKPRPNVGAGEIRTAKIESLLQSRLDGNSMVICRTNAPLLELALKLLNTGQQFELMSDYPERLAKLAARLAKGISGLAAFKTAVHEYYEGKRENITSDGLLARLQDEEDSIKVVADICNKPDDVAEKFRELMSCKYGPKLCTGHKSKGLEANHVFFLRPDLCPAPWVDVGNEEAYQQELNLRYVITTRAKNTLTYLE